MKSSPSLHVLLERLIDYAGLFPPANLSLIKAIENYANYINSNDSWMLGPFIIPVAKINELPHYRELFLNKKALELSVVGRKSSDEEQCFVQFREDLKLIHHFSRENSDWSNVKVYEIPLPPIVPTNNLIKEASTGAKELGMKVYCELTMLNGDNWLNNLSSTLDVISEFNSRHKEKVGVKLRAGGIKAEMFPSTEKVASVIALCRDLNLPIKFTAGLHHPVRMYREEVKTKMHGFLNIFLSGMLAYHFNLNKKIIEEIISDENIEHFMIKNDSLAWKHFCITAQEMKELRNHSLCSFGSCSFDEPKDELLDLINRQEVFK
ncbi:hypothetical protein H1Z61_10245 [Bacillus aquiflavi]|uniref:Uncharacterized protein n=1 Tax=Bacillus aquiflavi TaxID=2672567 RepID=A0A6B3VZR6_9BACI|nr:hypothetical protein [Bacillus aquiflavi]MBA4537501.1 hypothetical protein [Bacillus aquiflavi]NEY81757.1 hypothetical protein [Bacillus aquiflavi]UAC47465.1 hypothetical protein K6959_12300 [Bacillus aquiflavi]